jgi:hypothetical protein
MGVQVIALRRHKKDNSMRFRGALLPSCWQLKALSRRMVPLLVSSYSLQVEFDISS